MARPLLVGLQNPLSDDPRYALYSEPDGCAGHRLYEMLGVPWTQRDYLQIFDRVNLLGGDKRVGGRGYSERLRCAAWDLLSAIISRKSLQVVLLGADVLLAVRHVLGATDQWPWLSWQQRPLAVTSYPDPVKLDVRWLPMPHPSGRNRWYNAPGNREAAARELRRLAVMGDSP